MANVTKAHKALVHPEVSRARLSAKDAPFAILEAEHYTTAYTGGRLGGRGHHGYRLDTVNTATLSAWRAFRVASYTFRTHVTLLALEAERLGWPPAVYGSRLREALGTLGYFRLAEPAFGVDFRALAELLVTRPVVPYSMLEAARARVASEDVKGCE